MVLTLCLVAVACTADVDVKARAEDSAGSSATDPSAKDPSATVPPAMLPSAADSPTTGPDAESVAGCDRKSIGEESGSLAVAYAVDDGRLAATPCFGDASAVVEAAWRELAVITPPQLVRGVTLVAGFDDAGSDTLAFAGPVDDDSDQHLIAVGITAATDDPLELRLTMAHELAHVFTQTTDQIDVAFFSDQCDTFFNGFGCFQQDAYMTAWIDQFWSASELATLPGDHSADIEGGEQRCLVDAGFPGSYGASHPEEDFAESFSAYIFDVAMPGGFEGRLRFFDERPEFVAMRQAVRRSDDPVPPGNFDACG